VDEIIVEADVVVVDGISEVTDSTKSIIPECVRRRFVVFNFEPMTVDGMIVVDGIAEVPILAPNKSTV